MSPAPLFLKWPLFLLRNLLFLKGLFFPEPGFFGTLIAMYIIITGTGAGHKPFLRREEV